MSMNPGVQAKLMAFQAKRKQQMEQSKHVGSHENSEMSDDDTAVIDGGTLNASTFNNSKIINNDNNSNNNNNNNYDVMLSKYSPIEYISQFKVLLNKNSYLCIALCISFFSLIGIPPLSGFYGKLLILISALGNGYIFLSILLVISSSISAYYYGSVIKELCFDILNNYNVFNYKDISIYNKSLLSKMESMYITLKDNIISKNGNNILLMNNNISYQISLMTLIIILIIFEYDNIIRGTFIVTLNMI